MGDKFILNFCNRLGFLKSKIGKKCSNQILKIYISLKPSCDSQVDFCLFHIPECFVACWTFIWKDPLKMGNSSIYHDIIRLIPARLAFMRGPDVEQTCFLHQDVSVRNTNCKDFLCSHEKGRKQLVNVSQMVKLLASLRRGPPIQMAHYFNIWIFILLKHLFFFLVLFSIINSLTLQLTTQ